MHETTAGLVEIIQHVSLSEACLAAGICESVAQQAVKTPRYVDEGRGRVRTREGTRTAARRPEGRQRRQYMEKQEGS